MNAGASFAVVSVIAVFGFTDPFQYVWFAFVGASLAGALVFGLASIGRGAGNPLTLALAGQGVTVFLAAMTTAVALTDKESLNALRFWNAGSVAGVGFHVIGPVTGFVAVGLVLALITLPALNLLNLGDDVARALGVNIAVSRTIGIAAVTLLAGAATAACGPIAFLGLMVTHVARHLTGPDYRWLVPYAGLLGAVVLLVCDIAGRLVVRPGELESGVVVALLERPSSRSWCGAEGSGAGHEADPRTRGAGPAPASGTEPEQASMPPGVRLGTVSFVWRPWLVLVTLVLAAAAFLVFCLSIGVGDFPIALTRVVATLFGQGEQVDEFVIMDLRLPRALAGLIVGLALACPGPSPSPWRATPSPAPTSWGSPPGPARSRCSW